MRFRQINLFIFLNLVRGSGFLLLVCFFLKCTNYQTGKTEHNLAVTWELIHNAGFVSPYGKASIEIKNTGKLELGSANWLLYFNMLPRTVIPSGDTVVADVVHISGDWYKLVPRNDFKLKPDSSIKIYYDFEGFQIKKSDAPVGLYFVLYDDKGKETEVVPVEKYVVKSFNRKEQQLRIPGDCEPLPTSENLYLEYKRIHASGVPSLLPLIPSPVQFERDSGYCQVDNKMTIYSDESSKPAAEYLASKLNEISGLSLKVEQYPGDLQAGIYLLAHGVKSDNPEAYNLEIKPDHIQISGNQEGIFYGVQSLLKLIPFKNYKNTSEQIILPAVVVYDTPRFKYRGLHIDVCRNFQSKDQMLKVIDLMAWYKLNTLLLYLTEDEGWRMEIDGLPELTEISSKRGHTLNESDWLHPSYGSGPFPEGENHGTGYYSRKDFKEIIQYAYDRHIRVIPGINLPGHARAAIKAMEARYQNYKTRGNILKAEEFRLIDPADRSIYLSAQYYNDNVVCVARESVYHFVETVVDEVLKMYDEAGVPIDMIYTGGDEVPEGAWTGSPLCKELLNELPEIEDPKNLQKYFLERIDDIFHNRNLKTCGWEEIVLEKDADWNYSVTPDFSNKDVIPFVWNSLNGSQDLAYRIANEGYQVVLCPVTNFYFDLAYNNDPEEPGLYWNGFTNERDPWQMAPFNMFYTLTEDGMGCRIDQDEYTKMVRLKSDAKKNILGLQAQVWHETIRGGDMLEYYLLPKLIGFAERCWAQPEEWEEIIDKKERKLSMDRSWQRFEYTIYEQELPKLGYLNGGYNYRIPPAGATEKDGFLYVLPSNPSLKVRYTLNGIEPDNKSPIFKEPIKITGEIRLQVFDRSGSTSRISRIHK